MIGNPSVNEMIEEIANDIAQLFKGSDHHDIEKNQISMPISIANSPDQVQRCHTIGMKFGYHKR